MHRRALIRFKIQMFICQQVFSGHRRFFILQERLLESQKNNRLPPPSPRQSYSLYEKRARASSVSQCSHSATYTHLSHTALCAICNRTCTLAQERSFPILATHSSRPLALSPHAQLRHTHTHTDARSARGFAETRQTAEVSLSAAVVQSASFSA